MEQVECIDSLPQLKVDIAGRIRAVFVPGPVPPVYDLVKCKPDR